MRGVCFQGIDKALLKEALIIKMQQLEIQDILHKKQKDRKTEIQKDGKTERQERKTRQKDREKERQKDQTEIQDRNTRQKDKTE